MRENKFSLRFGICGCSLFYHGEIRDHQIVVNSLKGKHLLQPMVFELEEFLISAARQREGLRLLRCHFFLDVHKGIRWTGYQVTLKLNILVSNGINRGERLYIGGLSLIDPAKYKAREWSGSEPPPITDIVAGATELLQQFEENKLTRWLSTMSPTN